MDVIKRFFQNQLYRQAKGLFSMRLCLRSIFDESLHVLETTPETRIAALHAANGRQIHSADLGSSVRMC
jgi:hypothetical protein